MQLWWCVLFAFCAAAAPPAQRTLTSPPAAAGIEGTDLLLMFGARRLQGIDNGLPATPLLKSIAFRRDGDSATSASGAARTLDVQVVMGEGPFATYASTWSTNTTTSTVAHAKKSVVFPDWTQKPAVTPAPFDFVVVFDAPWSYTKTAALVWDIEVTNPSVALHAAMDRHGYSSLLGTSGDVLGTGCVATGRTFPFSHVLTLIDPGPSGSMVFRFSGSNGPSGAATALLVDTFDAGLTLAGLCGQVRSLGSLLASPVGTTSAGGSLATTSWTFPFDGTFVGYRFVTQLASVDTGLTGIPVAVSNGRSVAMPPYHEVGYVFGTPGSTTGTRIEPGTVPVARFTY